MRIDRLHIDGFGRAENADLILGNGLTLIRGANGTGKTTVHQFLHAILFGFVKDLFPLVRGGRRGGVISGVLADGRPFEVTRHGDPVTGANQRLEVTIGGETGGSPETRLRIVIGGVTKHVFESVFAFGQDELRDFGRLTNEDVANRIYGASIGVIADVLKVETNIDREIDALWKPRGANPLINRGLAAMADLRSQLTARDLPAEYGELRRRLGAIEDDRRDLETQASAFEGRRRELDRVLAARVPWQTILTARARLAGMPDEPVVTADDLAQEAGLAQAVRIATTNAGASRIDREGLDRQLAAVTYRSDVLDRAPETDDAVSAATSWRSREADLADTRRRATAVRASIDGALAEAGWDQATLRAMEPLPMRSDLAAHARDDLDAPLRNLGAPTERARAAAAGEELQRARLVEQDGRAAAAGADDGSAPAEELERQAQALEADLARAAALRESIAASPVVAPAATSTTAASGPTGAGAFGSPRVAGGLGLLSVVLGFALAVAVAPAVGITVAALGILASAALLALAGRERLTSPSPRPEIPATPPEHPMARNLGALEGSIAIRWSALGLPLPPTPGGLDPVRARVAAAVRQREERRAFARDRERAAADLSTASSERVAADAALAEAAAEVQAGAARWATFLSASRLPPGLDRDGAADLLARLDAARTSLEDATALGQGIGKTERERLVWTQGVLRLAADLGVPADDDSGVVVERLRQELAAARTSSRLRDALVQRRDEAGRIERGANATLAIAQAEHAAFLAGHGLPDGERLAARHARGMDRGKIQLEHDQAKATFFQLVPEHQRTGVEAELIASDHGDLVRQRDAVTVQIGELAERRDARTAEAATLEEQLRRLREEADTSRVRQELADRRAGLESAARRWLVLRTAAELLRRTRAEYEAKHRPAVLARAEALFTTWTDGEYSGFDRLSESGLEAVVNSTDGKRVPLTGLSRGTAEQLYLAMRIALVEHLATQQEPLPLVMDDVLVNFDPDRAQRVARTIEEVAQSRQVIYLTCHGEVTLRPTRTIELSRNVEVRSVAAAASVASR